MKIIAHRGASYNAPENTISSAREAWLENADGLEIDVHITLDRRSVVIHDENTKRVGDKLLIVSKSNFSDLRSVDVGLWKGERWKGEHIPQLSDILNLIPENKEIYIEIKSGNESVPSIINGIMDYINIFDRVTFISFDFDVVQSVKKLLPAVKVMWIIKFSKNVGQFSTVLLNNIISKIKNAGLDGISTYADIDICRKMAESVYTNDLLWNVWTVDDIEKGKVLHSLSITSLTTNRPAYLRQGLMNNL